MAAPGSADAAPITPELSLRADNYENNENFAREIARRLVSVDKPLDLMRPPPPKPASQYAQIDTSDPIHTSRTEANVPRISWMLSNSK